MIRSTMRSRLALVVALGTAAASVLGAGAATAAPRTGRHVLSGSAPRWLTRARATGGAPAAADKISFGVLLKLRDSAAAEATLASISDPASASYGKWLTKAQFTSRYAPATADALSRGIKGPLSATKTNAGRKMPAVATRAPLGPAST